jgi:hypothetical protein
VSACRKHSMSDVAASAPAFVCTALPLPESVITCYMMNQRVAHQVLGGCVSACRKHSISDAAALAPAFICTALPLPERIL